MQLKVTASEIFKDQKDSYPQSVGRLFLDSRLGMCSYMQLIHATATLVRNDEPVPGNRINKGVSVISVRT